MDRQVINEYALREFARQQDPIARQEPAALRQSAMLRDESVRRNAIAVSENHIIGVAGGHRFVAYGSSPKAIIFLPYVAHWEWGALREVCDDACRVRLGTIICDDQLEASVTLSSESGKDRSQGVWAIIGSHDDRDIGHRRLSIHALR